MEYNKLVAVTGLSGLYELINTKADGGIVRSLDDKKTQFVSSRIHHFTHLESIEIYTTGENVNLVDVFHAMQKAGGELPNEKDAAAIKAYFEKVYPTMDFDRVYNSDMKKMVKWFGILTRNGVEIKLTEMEEEAVEDTAAPAVEEKPAKKTKAAKKEKPAEGEEAAPKKKAAPKKAAKKAEEGDEAEAAPKKKAATKKK